MSALNAGFQLHQVNPETRRQERVEQIVVHADRGLKTGKLDRYVLTPDEAIALATELLDAVAQGKRVR